jgi:hypothetical protein
VVRADGGGGLRWLEPMVVAAFMHVGVGPTHVIFRSLQEIGSSIGDYIFVGTDEYIQIIFVGLDRAPTNI